MLFSALRKEATDSLTVKYLGSGRTHLVGGGARAPFFQREIRNQSPGTSPEREGKPLQSQFLRLPPPTCTLPRRPEMELGRTRKWTVVSLRLSLGPCWASGLHTQDGGGMAAFVVSPCFRCSAASGPSHPCFVCLATTGGDPCSDCHLACEKREQFVIRINPPS